MAKFFARSTSSLLLYRTVNILFCGNRPYISGSISHGCQTPRLLFCRLSYHGRSFHVGLSRTLCASSLHHKYDFISGPCLFNWRHFSTSFVAKERKGHQNELQPQTTVRDESSASFGEINEKRSSADIDVSRNSSQQPFQVDCSKGDAECWDRSEQHVHGNRLPLSDTDIDQELLRYDYEELESDVETPTETEIQLSRKPLPIELKRGKTGVFDIDELVSLLEDENARDICILPVPKEYHYVDYLVVATGRSTRHLRAMAQFIRWAYKRKRAVNDPSSVRIEGEQTRDWFAMDLGNIAVHLFLHETRLRYDLETLWTVGDTQEMQSQDGFSNFQDDFSFDNELERLRQLRDSKLQQKLDQKGVNRDPRKSFDKKTTVRSMEGVNNWRRQPEN